MSRRRFCLINNISRLFNVGLLLLPLQTSTSFFKRDIYVRDQYSWWNLRKKTWRSSRTCRMLIVGHFVCFCLYIPSFLSSEISFRLKIICFCLAKLMMTIGRVESRLWDMYFQCFRLERSCAAVSGKYDLHSKIGS